MPELGLAGPQSRNDNRATEYLYTSLRGWLNIAGQASVDIIKFSARFTVNSIPEATVVVAIGNNATDGIAGAGPTVAELAANRTRAQVVIEVNGVNVTMFDGYMVAVTTDRSPMTLGIQVHLVHWLDDLRSTSALNDQRTPYALFDVNGSLTQRLQAGGIAKIYGIVGQYARASALANANFGQLLGQLSLQIADGTVAGGQMTNTTAQQAFARLSTNLTFNFAAAFPSVKEAIANYTASSFYTVFNGGNLWASLLKLSQPFGYVIVPLINSAVFVAYAPVLQDLGFKSLPADTYTYAQMRQRVGRGIRGMILYTTKSKDTDPKTINRQAVNAFHEDPNQDSGMIDAEPLPKWLEDPEAANRAKGTAADVAGILGRARRSADDNANNPARESSAEEDARSLVDRQDIGQQYAQMRYLHKVFGANTVQITGPLRADIAPGTNIKFAVPDTEDETKSVFGYVNSVMIEVNSQNARAMTSFGVSHVRPEGQNRVLAMAGSPLYNAVLVTADMVNSALVFN